MNEWTVDIESGSGIAAGAEELERLARALDARTGTTGAAASANTRTGVISATFAIGASDAVRAAELGVAAFRDSLSAAGLTLGDPARVAVERVPRGDAVPA